jgi:predicted DNA-binding transcriptional regulator AlpA
MTRQSPEYQLAKSLLESPETLTLDAPEAALLLGISKPHCYQVIAETGTLAGLPIIKIGNRIKIPVGPLRALLGVTQLAP